MYIEPNGVIRILQDVPLDESYNHTLYFSSISAQTNYFASKAKYTLTDQSYSRYGRGVLKVQVLADDLYDCNYVMFQNAGHGNKWFYGFITKVEYSNYNMSEVYFALDPMQTWFFDYDLGMNFVVREHSVTDNIGDNLVEETLSTGPYTYSGGYQITELLDLSIVVAATFDAEYNDSAGGFYSGLYSALNFHKFPLTQEGVNDVIEFINGAGTKTDGIVSVFICPTEFITLSDEAPEFDINIQKSYDNIDGYVPKNKKLFTYPYNFLYIANNIGNAAAYKYEYFTEGPQPEEQCRFKLLGDMSCNPSAVLVPYQYLGAGYCWDEKITLEGYPQLPYVTDTFKVWLAQNASNIAVDVGSSYLKGVISTLGQVANAGASMAIMSQTGGAGGGGSSLDIAGNMMPVIDTVTGYLKQGISHYLMPDQAHGSYGNVNLVAHRSFNFFVYNKSITSQYAKIIDDYFSMFGYATNEVKIPNRSSRPHWNYVKTAGCVLTGSIPADDAKTICVIYDNGITFWKNPGEVGNYNLNNSP